MINLLRKLFVLLTGFFTRTGDNMVASSPEAIRATYAAAIQQAKLRYKSMQQALALMMGQQKRLEASQKDLENQKAVFEVKLRGAVIKAQEEPENAVHKQVGAKYLTTIDEIKGKIERIRTELAGYDTTLKGYNVQLITLRDEVDNLRRKEGSDIAEFISSKTRLQLEERFAGLSTNSAVDESLVAIQEQIERMKNEADIATKIRIDSSTDVYAQVGAEEDAGVRFDELVKQSQTTVAEPRPLLEHLVTESPVVAKTRDLG